MREHDFTWWKIEMHMMMFENRLLKPAIITIKGHFSFECPAKHQA